MVQRSKILDTNKYNELHELSKLQNHPSVCISAISALISHRPHNSSCSSVTSNSAPSSKTSVSLTSRGSTSPTASSNPLLQVSYSHPLLQVSYSELDSSSHVSSPYFYTDLYYFQLDSSPTVSSSYFTLLELGHHSGSFCFLNALQPPLCFSLQ